MINFIYVGQIMRSEAQKKADKKYRESEKNNYTAISSGMTKAQADTCKEYAAKIGLSPSKFALNAMLYCIENNIDFKNE